MGEDKVFSLSSLEFLSDLSSQELTELAHDFQWEEYEEGSEIIKQGQEQNSFYILTEGKAAVFINKEGRPWRVHSFVPGDVFGELSLLTGKPSPTSIRCLKKCRVLALDVEGFGRMLLRWPHLNQTFVSRVFQNLNDTNLILSEAKYKEYLRSNLQLTQYKDKFYGLWGSVKTTKEIERKLEELAQTSGNLLLTGERGTGRQMMAWYIHQRRFGEKSPFVAVEGLRFDQQWGGLIVVQASHEGSTTFPNNSLFDIAKGGTLYIGEIDLISPQTQLKLSQALNTLKNKCYVIGSTQAERDASGPKIIPELLECFIQTYEITPLRERKRDIPILAQGILEKMALKNNRKVPTLNQEATQLLLSHHYRHGNVTELIQVIERSFFLAEKDVIGLEQIFFGPTSEKSGLLINLLSWPKVENFLKKGTFILWLQRISALIFSVIVLLLLFAPTVTLTTKIFVLLWGLWWPALAIISPFLGRLWCTVCPFSTIMNFVQKKLHLNRPVPDFFIKYDYLVVSILFLLILWFEVITAMRFSTAYTAGWLITIQAAAIFIGILYPRHTWCRHFCPLGGFIGTASIGSMLEVRADASVCLNKCTTFECYVGKDKVPGCPMSQHLPYLDNNLNCKLCFNCVRNCPNGSVQVNLRIPGREVWHLVRVNQGYVIFIGVMFTILFPIMYFEPLQALWASTPWKIWFSLSYWGAALVGGILTWWIAKPFKTKATSLLVKLVFAFTPIVLAGHIIYRLNFIPGLDSLLLGVGYMTSSGLQSFYLPATHVARVIAATFGLILTAITIALVLKRNKVKRQAKPVHSEPK